MNKLLCSALMLLLFSGCAEEHGEVVVSGNRSIADEITGVYDPDHRETELNSDAESSSESSETAQDEMIPRDYQYVGNPDVMVTLNWDFFIEGNPCIFDDHIVAIVGFVNEDTNEMGLEVGSNCYDHSRQGPSVIIGLDDIPIQGDGELEVYDLLNIHYEFPEGFVPVSYVDYLNYATVIEKQ